MKKTVVLFLLSLCFFACNNKKTAPDVSGIKVDLKLERFDRDLFAIDSNNILPGLGQLYRKYPLLTNIFLDNILGLDSAHTLEGVKRFLALSQPIHDTVEIVFQNTDQLKKDFEKAFRYVNYYFPSYKAPMIVTLVGPIDALAQGNNGYTPDFIGPGFLGISLQFYLGDDFSIYNDPLFIEKVVPKYRSRRFSREYIIADAMMLVVDDLFPDQSNGKPLVEQMIEKGKQWYLLDQFLPGVPDSIKTGFTQDQLDWCKENEGLIWTYIVKNEDLNSLNPTVIQTYLGDGPFTQGFSQEQSPGNMGQWIGWQIVKKFVAKNKEMKPEEIMRTDARKILDEAKYKPK